MTTSTGTLVRCASPACATASSRALGRDLLALDGATDDAAEATVRAAAREAWLTGDVVLRRSRSEGCCKPLDDAAVEAEARVGRYQADVHKVVDDLG